MKYRLTLSMEKEKVKELKKKAIDYNMTLSDLLAEAGTFYEPVNIIVTRREK